ncbi:hypothetical protein EIP91_009402 [Steccherinum ochraceum]|uniref:Uncharacterized protein n=1 Tax=Steccherinum ochraceum TaxID=92696 RepID=A0A4R0R4C3_9APHY|nr:hypothetical protein EIP91_009402 [Steccherinum ochraceum]
MTTQIAQLTDNLEEDGSRVPTPIASSHNARFSEASTVVSPPKDTNESNGALDDEDAVSPAAASTHESSASEDESPASAPEPSNAQFLLPLPTPSSSRSQSFSVPSDSHPDLAFIDLPLLPPDLASAEVTVAPDGSFVETSSGAAARELKRIYDQRYGVGKEVRSPYAITAFVNQHGKQMYRLGTRELSAPAATSADDSDIVPNRAKSQAVSSGTRDSHASAAPKAKRGSRMSVHSFLPPTMFNKTGSISITHPKPTNQVTHVEEGSRSPPVRKLRKTRSIPNMNGAEGSSDPSAQAAASNGRPHAHSVSSADAFRASAIVAELTRPGLLNQTFFQQFYRGTLFRPHHIVRVLLFL